MHAHRGNIPLDLKAQLAECWRAGVHAGDPQRAVLRALEEVHPGSAAWQVLALGKAAPAMAAAAVGWLSSAGRVAAGGLVVATADAPEAGGLLPRITGDHPAPGGASAAAADRLGAAVGRMGPDDSVLVLLSGGASSLVAAPVAGVTATELAQLWRLLLGSGVDIHVMNAVRRRFVRWGGGRLARALAPRRVEVLAISDVPGDDPAVIGSGPCAGDPLASADIRRLLAEHDLLAGVPPAVRALLERDASEIATLPPDDDAFRRVHTRVVAANRDAVGAAARHAAEQGWDVRVHRAPITGEAADAGRALAAELIGTSSRPGSLGVCIVAGGETTVSLPAGAADPAPGGRCQELALAAAEVLAARGAGTGAALLAAGTDGRDGPTDAAGGLVDGETWTRVERAGRDPQADLASHRSYEALDSAGALFRSGATGTNLMDLVIALRVVLPGRLEVAAEEDGDVDQPD